MEFYTLIEMQNESVLGSWEGQLGNFNSTFGYSHFGHFFLYSTTLNAYGVLHPMKNAFKSYGEFESVDDFVSNIIKDDGFIEFVFKPNHYEAVKQHVGALEKEEVYIPQPYPFLGGSDEPTTYGKGNVWVFIDLVGQSHGHSVHS